MVFLDYIMNKIVNYKLAVVVSLVAFILIKYNIYIL
jgi:hypothetical protein